MNFPPNLKPSIDLYSLDKTVGNYTNSFSITGPDYGYPPRDSRTLTWDRNPKPDRNDPKYFPVNSLPRHPGNGQRQVGPAGVVGGPVNNSMNSPGMPIEEGMPPPMRELNTTSVSGGSWGPNSDYPVSVSAGGNPSAINPQGPPGDFYNAGPGGSNAPVGGQVESEPGPGRGQRLLHRMQAQDQGYRHGPNDPVGPNSGTNGVSAPPGEQQRYSTLQYQRQYPRGAPNGGMVPPPRSRHYSGMDYASDTEALQSPVLSVRGGMRSMVDGPRGRGGHGSRTNSLPRTFQREALLRHPELSMEMDRLASPSSGLPMMGPHDDPMSDSGIISAPENIHSGIRGKRGTKKFVITQKPYYCHPFQEKKSWNHLL